MAINLTSKLPAAGAGRQAQVPNGNWTNGMNAASCQPGIGHNTADYSPKEQDFGAVVIDPLNSQWLGGIDGNLPVGGNVTVALLEPVDGNDTFAFVQADAATAPDAELDAATGAVNRTGKTVPLGAWCWGTVPVA